MNDEQTNAFEKLKKTLSEITYKSIPDTKKEFILTTDASNIAIGGILTQCNSEGKQNFIEAFSKTLDEAQKNYSVTDKELLAVVKSIENFRHYLIGKPFTLRTDHKALEYLWSTKNQNSRLLRWSLKLQEYSFKPEYIKGDENIADGLSRQHINIIDSNVNELSINDKEKILNEYHLKSARIKKHNEFLNTKTL